MKICAVISEYNPFHNGHRYLLDQIRSTGEFDAVLCLMSGNFCQRGEAAVLDKYTRATHALLGGADAVIELPVVFATGSAEIFARGAIRLLSAIPSVKAIAFGCEKGTKQLLWETARATLVETETFRSHLQAYLAEGIGYAAARERAWRAVGVDTTLFASPNDILGLEYTKAILREGSPIDVLPVRRIGDGYNDATPSGTFASASAIRAHRRDEALLDRYVPPFVKDDLLSARTGFFPFACRLALEETSREQLRSI
ncbi:MAG: nucleotidyltransferase family protein, partial [Christensenellaceae bacterium]